MQAIKATLDQCAALEAQTQFAHVIYVPATLEYRNTFHPINNNPSPNDPGPGGDDIVSEVGGKGNLFYVPTHTAMLGVPSPGVIAPFPTLVRLPPSLSGIVHASGSAQGQGPGGSIPAFSIHVSISGKFPFEVDLNFAVAIQSDAGGSINFHVELNGTMLPIKIHESKIVAIADSNNSAESTSDLVLQLEAPIVMRKWFIPGRAPFHI
jgi:hypothetical protein